MNKRNFSLQFAGQTVFGDLYGEQCDVLILHGAGQSNRGRFESLRLALLEQGIGSGAFDFIGHGETAGELIGSSLAEREALVKEVIESQQWQPKMVIGSSMSGYTTIKLSQYVSFEHMVLRVPGIYTPEAYNVPFGPAFSEVIRRPNSWQQSDAFEILSQYTGSVLILAAENDSVIPLALVEALYKSCKSAATCRLDVVPKATHSNLYPSDAAFLNVVETIVSSLKR